MLRYSLSTSAAPIACSRSLQNGTHVEQTTTMNVTVPPWSGASSY
ncbi:hypothetical protein [Propionivibrio sp.]|nr:hypothetical protein [Propionivibrio sp.]